jgi:putative Mg2+ transporter-C (MgtC) family protein
MNIPPPSLVLGDVVSRLCWGLLLGSAIGFERQWHQKMAGLKTNALVALGSAGFVTFATAAGQGNPSQVSGQIVSGIGFLGAGVIMREGVNIHGLNTAATLWCSAMVGALCGFGMWQAGGVAAAMVLGANLALRPVANHLNTRVQAGSEIESRYTLAVTCAAAQAQTQRKALLAALAENRLPVLRLSTLANAGQTIITVDTLSPHVADAAVEQVLETVAQDGNVSGTSWQVSRAAPEA